MKLRAENYVRIKEGNTVGQIEGVFCIRMQNNRDKGIHGIDGLFCCFVVLVFIVELLLLVVKIDPLSKCLHINKALCLLALMMENGYEGSFTED